MTAIAGSAGSGLLDGAGGLAIASSTFRCRILRSRDAFHISQLLD